ncbi:DNA polymerase III subunit delta [Rhizobium halophytocola]|uniref:DNA-directed DNA polymerase n=1 Tax=Rhizobium halophytocola TaxID=735519 RepID=A0ABS4E1P5_9HYPH|nr:DNA polymerase III subunit delta [Rhizobium halophytocola]MBP1851859.1 DNA polymerase-3 subunit delta [Rhizobium halophytocola]
MTEVKGYEFDASPAKFAKSHRIFLFCGPDRGLVSERAGEVAKHTGIALDDPFAVVRLDAGDLQGDPGRLLDETQSMGLFGGDRLVWLRGSGSEKALVDGLNLIAANPSDNCYVIIEAGELRKAAGARKPAETSRNIALVVCYADDTRAMNGLIDAEFAAAGQRLTPDAREFLLASLGGDRIASRNELRKLSLYCLNEQQIDLEHVMAIIGDASAISVDEAVDAVLSGRRDEFLHAAQKILASKTSVFLLLQACLRQFQQMDAMRAHMETEKQQVGQVMQTLGRGIHFKRKPLIERALRAWNAEDLARETTRIGNAIFQTRQRPVMEENIALQTLLATTLQSARRLAQ